MNYKLIKLNDFLSFFAMLMLLRRGAVYRLLYIHLFINVYSAYNSGSFVFGVGS